MPLEPFTLRPRLVASFLGINLGDWFSSGPASGLPVGASIDTDANSPALTRLFGLNEGTAAVTHDSALGLSAVYACVDRISKSIGALSWDVLTEAEPGQSLKAKAHPVYKLLHNQPHPLYTSSTFRRVMLTHLLLRGNFYAEIQVDGRYRPVALRIWQPWQVNVTLYNDRLYYTLPGGRTLQDYEMIHLKGFSTDGLIGRSPIQVSRDTYQMALETQRFGTAFYQNGTSLSGVMSTENKVARDAKLEMASDFNEKYGGTKGAGKTAFLSDGWKYQQIGVPPSDAQYLDTRKFSRTEICGLFGVPPHMVMDLENATFSNIENQNIWYVTHTLMPLVVGIEEEFGRKLFREDEAGTYSNKINLNALMRGDTAARTAYYTAGRTNGYLSANEVRALEDMNAYDGGDLYTVQGAQIPVNQLSDFYAQKIAGGDLTPVKN